MTGGGSQLQPYRGDILRLSGSFLFPHRWVLSVATWEGRPRRARPLITEVFDVSTLRGQLVAVRFPLRRIVTERGQQELTIHAVRGEIPAGSTAQLLSVLREHYNVFKGRPITWTLTRR